MNVLYQFDDKYAPFATVSICSLLENNKGADDIVIYTILDGVSEDNKRRLTAQVDKYGRTLKTIDAGSIVSKLERLGVNTYRGSHATNLKMFLSDFLPDTLGRILYIDSDTLVVGDIGDIMSVDMQGKPIAMVLDSISVSHKKDLGFAEDEDYFNGGVILYDLRRWNDERCGERIEQFLSEGSSTFMAPDQDILNIVFRNEIAKLRPEYNLQPFHVAYDYKTYDRYFHQDNYYKEDAVEQARRDVRILHCFRYLGQFPWHKDNLHPDSDLFDRYLEISEYSDYQKQPTDYRSFPFKVERGLYRTLPKKMFIPVFRLFYDIWVH